MKRVQLARKVKYNIHAISSHKPLQDAWRQIWNEIKLDADGVLRHGSLTIDSFAKTFQMFGLTADPRVGFRFAPIQDRLWLNVWVALFYPPFQIAGSLVHEDDHRKFESENGILGASFQKVSEFFELHAKELEIRAHEKELDFLKSVRNSIDPKWTIRLNQKDQITYEIGGAIAFVERSLEKLSSMSANAAEYMSLATNVANAHIVKNMKILNIDLSGMGKVIKREEPILWETAF